MYIAFLLLLVSLSFGIYLFSKGSFSVYGGVLKIVIGSIVIIFSVISFKAIVSYGIFSIIKPFSGREKSVRR